MDIREQLTKRPRLTVSIAAVTIVFFGLFAVWQLQGGGRPQLPVIPDQAFYTIDDGATLFVDSINKLPPFDHNGMSAVRARVYTCDHGKHQWVQFLEKYSDSEKKLLEGLTSPEHSPYRTVKKPGQTKWVSERDPEAMEIMDPKCPDGMGRGLIEPVSP